MVGIAIVTVAMVDIAVTPDTVDEGDYAGTAMVDIMLLVG